MRKKILMLVTIVSLIACTEDDPIWNTVEYSLVGQGALYGNGDEGIEQSNLVINDADSWNALISKMDAVNDVSGSFDETEIDFDQYQIIAVFDGIRSTGGYTIDVVEIAENETKLKVFTECLGEGNATTVMTQPFQIVKISKTDKVIEFE